MSEEQQENIEEVDSQEQVNQNATKKSSGTTKKKSSSTASKKTTSTTSSQKEEPKMDHIDTTTTKNGNTRKPGIKQIREEYDIELRMMERFMGNNPSKDQRTQYEALQAARKAMDGDFESLKQITSQ